MRIFAFKLVKLIMLTFLGFFLVETQKNVYYNIIYFKIKSRAHIKSKPCI